MPLIDTHRDIINFKAQEKFDGSSAFFQAVAYQLSFTEKVMRKMFFEKQKQLKSTWFVGKLQEECHFLGTVYNEQKKLIDSHQGFRRQIIERMHDAHEKNEVDLAHMALESTAPTHVEFENLARLLEVNIVIFYQPNQNPLEFMYAPSYQNRNINQHIINSIVDAKTIFLHQSIDLATDSKSFSLLSFRLHAPIPADFLGRHIYNFKDTCYNSASDLKHFFKDDFPYAMRGFLLRDYSKDFSIKKGKDWSAMGFLIVADILTITRSFGTAVAPVFLSEAIESLKNDNHTSLLELFGKEFGPYTTSTLLLWWAGILAGDKLVRAINEAIIAQIQIRASENMIVEDGKFLDRLHCLNYEAFEEYINKTGASTVASILIRNTEEMSTLVTKHVQDFMGLITTSIVAFALLITDQSENGKLSVSAALFMTLYIAYNMLARVAFTYYQRNTQKKTQKYAEEFNGIIVEDLRNEETTKLYLHDNLHSKHEKNVIMKFLKQIIENDFFPAIIQVIFFDAILMMANMIAIVSENVDDPATTNIDDLVLLINYFILFYALTQSFGENFLAAINATHNIKRIEEINEANESDLEKSAILSSSPTIYMGGTSVATHVVPFIEFKNVSYVKNGKTLLDNISFIIYEGESCALVGQTGSGKTTIIRLLCGLYKPTRGTILIRGADINEDSYSEITLRSKLTFISSNTQTWAGIKNSHNALPFNILYGHVNEQFLASLRDDTGTPLEININNNYKDIYNDKLNQANITHLTHLNKPSDGERQRVGLARGWRETEIMILDEPTSAMDSITESNIIKRFNDFIKTSYDKNKNPANTNPNTIKTLIITGHRLSTVIGCTKIIVLEGGVIKNQPSITDYPVLDEHGVIRRHLSENSSYLYALIQGTKREITPLSPEKIKLMNFIAHVVTNSSAETVEESNDDIDYATNITTAILAALDMDNDDVGIGEQLRMNARDVVEKIDQAIGSVADPSNQSPSQIFELIVNCIKNLIEGNPDQGQITSVVLSIALGMEQGIGRIIYSHNYLLANHQRYKEYFEAQQGPTAPSFALNAYHV